MRQRGQAALELGLVIPLLLLAIGGVVDVGRAFYYKIAVSNAAREAAHWATLPDPIYRMPPSDEQIGIDVTQPSQESFGLGMSLAPLCSVGAQQDTCDTTTIRHASPPINGGLIDTSPMDNSLSPGNSWLFIYPNQTNRTASRPSSSQVAWRLVNQHTAVVSAPDPQHGGVAAALTAAGKAFLPVDAEAASASCYSFGAPSVSPSAASVDPGSDLSFSVALPVTGDGRPPANSAQLVISGVTPSFNGTYSQLWSPPSGNNNTQASLALSAGTSYTETAYLTLHIGTNTAPNTYSFTVTASSNGGGCTPANVSGTFSVTVGGVAQPPPGSGSDDFLISDNPSIIGTTPGNTATSNVTVQAIGSFSSDVNVSTVVLDPGGSPTTAIGANPNPTVVAGGNGTFQLALSASPGAAPGAYQVTITGQPTGPTPPHSVNLELDVGAAGSTLPPANSSAPKAHQIICGLLMRWSGSSSSRRSRGQAATEFALIAPLFFVVLFGLIDLTRAVYSYNIISNAAREGAREAILGYNQCSNLSAGALWCESPPPGSSLVGVEPAIMRAAGGAVSFDFANADQSTNTGSPTTCVASVNRGCVFVFVNGGANAVSCVNAAANPDTGPGPTDHYPLCNYNTTKSSGAHNVVVEIEYQFQPSVPLLSNFLGNGITLWAKSEMRTEY